MLSYEGLYKKNHFIKAGVVIKIIINLQDFFIAEVFEITLLHKNKNIRNIIFYVIELNNKVGLVTYKSE